MDDFIELFTGPVTYDHFDNTSARDIVVVNSKKISLSYENIEANRALLEKTEGVLQKATEKAMEYYGGQSPILVDEYSEFKFDQVRVLRVLLFSATLIAKFIKGKKVAGVDSRQSTRC